MEKKLLNFVITDCFSQDKKELIVRFESDAETFFIRASLLPSFSCLSFPQHLHRARKNSVNIFEGIIGQRVNGIRQYSNERSFSIQLSHHHTLLFKMHGNRSNVVHFVDEKPVALFKNNLANDWSLALDILDRQIDWTFDNFVRNNDSLRTTYFTFGNVVWRFLKDQRFFYVQIDEQWAIFQHLLNQLDDPKYYTNLVDEKLTFSLLPIGTIISIDDDPIIALNNFFIALKKRGGFEDEMASATSAIRSRLQSSEAFRSKTAQRLSYLENDSNFKMWADLIMANLHALHHGAENIILPNFYDRNTPVEIKLKKELSPVANAELFYRKSKNQQIEIRRLKEVLKNKDEEIDTLHGKLNELESIKDRKALALFIDSNRLNASTPADTVPLPYHTFEYQGFKILVGKNSQSNDKLTMKHSYKEDLWLHAKDVAGSHVIIKYQSGKKFPKDVIERAAELAAYNSKRKTESLCPVIFTPRKYVRKRKGDPAGTVIVEREETVIVQPRLEPPQW